MNLSEELLQDLAYSLDRVKGNEEYWRLLIQLLPKKTYPYNRVDVERIAFVGITGKGSPSLELLRDFQKGMELSYFKSLLQTIECQGALDCFKKPTKPVIRVQPVPVTVNVNERLELQCTAKCIPEPPDYQWFYYPPNGTSALPMKGKKSWKLVIDKVAMSNTGYYCCRVQNRRLKEDKYAEFSDYATVTVKHKTHTEFETSGGFIPVQEVTDQGHVTLKSQSPASIPPLCDVIDGVKVTHPEESTGSVSPLELIRIDVQPESQTVRLKKAEEKITLHCQAESLRGQQLEYKWYYLRGNDNPVTLKKENKTVRSTEPHIDITLKLANKQEYRYFCEVSVANHPEYAVASEVAVIKLQSVWFVEQPKEKYVAVTGNELKLSCRVETAPGVTVKYQWFRCQQNGTGKQPTSYYDNVMVLPAIIANQGHYLCSVMATSIHSDVAHVEVVNSTNITVKDVDQPPSDRYMELNEKLVIKFKATCKHFPMKYQWYHNFKELPGCTDPTLTINSVAVHHVGSYYCEASSDYSDMSVTSETCRVHWKGSNPSLPTINRQQIDAEEVYMVDNRICATDKMALLIGNSSYKEKPLKCSKNDVEAVTDKLRQLNFKTISLVDLSLSQMAKAVDYFCSLLDQGMYAMLYYSGHGLEFNKTTYLMPIDADEPVKIGQCMNVDDVAAKMQARKAKVFMILDCCRINLSPDDARSAQQLSSVPSGVNQSSGFSNLCQLFACSPSFETYESKDGRHSYMTEAFLQEVDEPQSVLQALSTIRKYGDQKFPGKVAPRSQLVLQMNVADQISFHDLILNEQELKEKELLLNLPKTCRLEFTNPKLKNACGQVELRFSAKFSNVMIVHIVCSADLQPEVVGVGLKTELECDIENEGDKIITSFKITDLLDVVQDKDSKLQISFQMPQDSSAKDTLYYRIPADLIKPMFHRH